tara:strand:- start:113 stop:304 length:192 start_codon:yes stop_codon:yes gene_type:complete
MGYTIGIKKIFRVLKQRRPPSDFLFEKAEECGFTLAALNGKIFTQTPAGNWIPTELMLEDFEL